MYPTKRPLDLVVSGLACVALLPVWAILLTLVWVLDRHHPVFTQERIGLEGERFNLYKIKSMKDGAPTRLGAWLRNTSLDETLQFVNVLKGDMSIVGPRPEMPVFAEYYSDFGPWYDRRHEVRPGITGAYQLYAHRKHMPIELRIDIDNEYVIHCSLLRDLRIMRKTPRAMLNGE